METLETYVGCIGKAYPDLHIANARLDTAGGQSNVIVLVNDDLIFRFPRSAAIAATYPTYRALLHALANELPLPIPVPRYAATNAAPWQHQFVGYTRIVGKPLYANKLATLNESDRNAIAQQLTEFLQTLHQLDSNKLPVVQSYHDTRAEWEALYAGIRTQLFPYIRSDARDQVVHHFESYWSHPDQHVYQPAIRHGDFGGSNILYNSERKRVSGVIDFDSVGLGDPAVDAAALAGYGEDFFARCEAYYPELQTMHARIAFYRGTFALQEAYNGLRNGNTAAFQSGIATYL